MGIGRLVDAAIAAYFLRRKVAPETWAFERAHAVREPKADPGGSNNHALAARVMDLVTGHSQPGDNPRWRDPRAWLAAWYEIMARAHNAFEALSTVYDDIATSDAMFAAAYEIPGALEHLQRQLALCALHRTWDGQVVTPGCRSAWLRGPARDQWTAYMLYRQLRPRGAARLAWLAASFGAAEWVDPQSLDASLATVRLAPGELVHRRHERGFVSWFPAGPRCYAYPMPAVVCVDGREPELVRPPYTPKRGLPFGCAPADLRTHVDGGELVSRGGAWEQRVDLRPLGELVVETRIPAAEGV